MYIIPRQRGNKNEKIVYNTNNKQKKHHHTTKPPERYNTDQNTKDLNNKRATKNQAYNTKDERHEDQERFQRPHSKASRQPHHKGLVPQPTHNGNMEIHSAFRKTNV